MATKKSPMSGKGRAGNFGGKKAAPFVKGGGRAKPKMSKGK